MNLSMKRLFLVRHAAANKISTQQDINYHLSADGLKEAAQLTSHIQAKNYHFQKVFCSVALRARETGQEIVRHLPYHPNFENDSKLYNCSDNYMLSFISELDPSLKSVMIIGHNPSITTVMNLIRPNCSMENAKTAFNLNATCKMVVIEISSDSWQNINTGHSEIIDVFIPQA